jgi:predicted DNA-binding transcriptional regulator AlpA
MRTAAETIRALADTAPADELPALAGALASALSAVLARSAALPSPAIPKEPVELLDVDAAAMRLGVAPSWLYRHAGKLPFTRKLSHKALRFDAKGLERWAANRAATP